MESSEIATIQQTNARRVVIPKLTKVEEHQFSLNLKKNIPILGIAQYRKKARR